MNTYKDFNGDEGLTEEEIFKKQHAIQAKLDFIFIPDEFNEVGKKRDERIPLLQGQDIIINNKKFIIIGLRKRKCKKQIVIGNDNQEMAHLSIDDSINSLVDLELKKILLNTCQYICFNKNPANKKCGDCFIRAYATVSDQSWDEAFIELAKFTCKFHDTMNTKTTIHAFLKENNYEKIELPRTAINKVASEYKNGLIITTNHAVAIIDGRYYDTFDSGEKKVTDIYIKKE